LPAQSTEIAPFLNSDGDLRTLPAHWPEIGGMDGFYAARLRLARASGA
jgi:16S rRNA (cytosine967-C5)-methyltransferase